MSGRVTDIAAGLFALNGYSRTTVRAVARAADLTPAALFRRFQTKEGLLAAAVEELMSDLDQLLMGSSRSSKDVDRIDIIRGYLLVLLRHRESAQILLFDEAARKTSVAEGLTGHHRRLVALLVGPRGSIDRQVRTRCAIAIAQLGAGELRGVPVHRLRQPLLDAAVDSLLGPQHPQVELDPSDDIVLDLRTGRPERLATDRTNRGTEPTPQLER